MSTDAATIRTAKAQAERARKQLIATAAQLQQRLRPATLAGNAWEGVKDRSGALADDAMEAVKARPIAASAVLAAFTLFLARSPIKAAVSRVFSSDSNE